MFKKEELKTITSVSIALAAIVSLTYMFVLKKEVALKNVISGVSFGISTTTLFWTFHFSYGWKWYPLDKIFYRPNLNGTWSGKLVSDWKNEEGNSLEPIDFFIVIRQSFIKIHFTTFTNNFVGVSYAETFSLNKDIGLKNIAYLYKKDTSQKNDDFLQEGATELRLIISDFERKLDGKYWSNTKTQGLISVKFVSKKQVDSFDDAQKL